MADRTYEIAPKPDTVLILKNPLANFAVWNPTKEAENQCATSTATKNDIQCHTEVASTAGEEVLEAQNCLVETDTIPSDSITAADGCAAVHDENGSACGSVQTQSSQGAISDVADNFSALQLIVYQELAIELPAGGVHYLVSSEYLKLASSTFASVLGPRNRIGGSGQRDGRYYVIIDDCDEEAMTILLNIIHLRNRQVPREVNLETLANIAVLIERYKCFEETEVFTHMWVEKVTKNEPPPGMYCRELMLWLCIAWVFRLQKVFLNVTTTAVKLAIDGKMRTMGLPVPQAVTDGMDRKRLHAIDNIHLQLQRKAEHFRDPRYKCKSRPKSSLECGAMLFGGLVKEMDAAGFYASAFKAPFEGVSVKEVRDRVGKFQSYI